MYYIKTSDNVNLAVYDIAKENPKTIVLVHGWPLDHRLFEYQVNVLPQFGYRVILIDLRGFGKSERPWNGYSYDRLADDLYDVIKALNLTNFSLLGFSMGGAIVSRYMSRHQGYGVNKLLLVSAATPHFTKSQTYPYAAYSKEEINQLIEKLFHDRPNALNKFGEQFFFQYKSAPLLNWFNNMTQSESSYATIQTLISLREEDLTEDVQTILVPTAILHGKQDQICPYPLAEATHKLIRSSTLIPFDQGGHGVFIDQIDLFNQTILAFLENRN